MLGYTDCAPLVQDIIVDKFVIHPRFSYIYNDVALLLLDKKVVYNGN